MKIELTNVSSVKKTLEIEVDAETVARETDAVIREMGRKVRVDGFRPGKVPAAVVRRRFSAQAREEARDRLLSLAWREAAEQKGLRPLGEPVVDDLTFEEGKPFQVKLTVEVLPEFEPKNYRGVEVREVPVHVGEADLAKALEELRESRARLVAEEGRPAATGDFLVVDLVGTPEGGEPFRREGTLVEVGAADNLPAFNEHLEGAEAGSRLEFSVDYPKEYGAEQLAGKAVHYAIDVREVKRREVPELDDEFARDLGDFDDVEALRERVREDLTRRREAEAKRALRESVLEKVMLENPVPLPDALVEDEIKQRLEDMVRAMILQGMDPRRMELDWSQLRQRQEEPARRAVHARLVLDAVAREEGLEVDPEEVGQRVREEAARMGEKYETVRSKLQKGGGMQALSNQLLREKALDLLTSVANISREET